MTPVDFQPVKVLALTTAEHEYSCLQHILDHSSWNLWRALNVADAIELIQRHRIPVVVTCEQLPDGNWKEALSELRSLPERPEVVLMTSKSDENLWSEALAYGVYDVIAKPFDHSEVFRIVSLAWRQWRYYRYGHAAARFAQKATA